MTMVFVNGKEDGSSDADKTYNVTQYKASRHTGSKTTSGQNQVNRVCNIFNLEGNYWEYVAEMSPSDKNTPFVARGDVTMIPIQPLSVLAPMEQLTSGSFRFVLYVK